MALSNYTELSAAIATFAWRTGDTDFTAAIPQFIALAETVMNHGGNGIAPLRVREMEEYDTITLTSGVGDLPSDYLEFREVRAETSPKRTLTPIDPNFGDAQYSNAASGYPLHFAIRGSEIITYPSSSANLTLYYYKLIPALTSSASTNWLLTKAPNAYLYGALSQAELYSRDEARGAMFTQMFAAALDGLRTSNTMSLYARASSRVRGPTP